jgi:hypothetical protein
MEEFKKIELCSRDINGYELDKTLIIDDITFEFIDDVKKYIIYYKKDLKFIKKLYKKHKISDQDLSHLCQWFYLYTNVPFSEEENKKAHELWNQQIAERWKNKFGLEVYKDGVFSF